MVGRLVGRRYLVAAGMTSAGGHRTQRGAGSVVTAHSGGAQCGGLLGDPDGAAGGAGSGHRDQGVAALTAGVVVSPMTYT